MYKRVWTVFCKYYARNQFCPKAFTWYPWLFFHLQEDTLWLIVSQLTLLALRVNFLVRKGISECFEWCWGEVVRGRRPSLCGVGMKGWCIDVYSYSDFNQPYPLYFFDEFRMKVFNLENMHQFLVSLILLLKKCESGLGYHIKFLVLF